MQPAYKHSHLLLNTKVPLVPLVFKHSLLLLDKNAQPMRLVFNCDYLLLHPLLIPNFPSCCLCDWSANATAYAAWMQTRLFHYKTPERYLWEIENGIQINVVTYYWIQIRRLCDFDANAAAYAIWMQTRLSITEYMSATHATLFIRTNTWSPNTEFKVAAYATLIQTRPLMRLECERGRLCDLDANAAI